MANGHLLIRMERLINTFEFKPLHEADLKLMHQWFHEPIIKQSYARGQNFTYEDINNKYLPRIVGHENVPSFIVYQQSSPIGFIQYYFLTENLPEGVKNYTNPLFNQYKPDEIAGIDCFIAKNNDRGKGKGVQIINAFIAEFLKTFTLLLLTLFKIIIQQYAVMKKQVLNEQTLVMKNSLFYLK